MCTVTKGQEHCCTIDSIPLISVIASNLAHARVEWREGTFEGLHVDMPGFIWRRVLLGEVRYPAEAFAPPGTLPLFYVVARACREGGC